ncbi:ABC transporter permease [Aquamicrobium sp. LC103]|uniref:ABC transporter permease n=1 Tax=Aquamicrobium sp. LC103 TaxID=1120658 RepID=UPI00063E7D11|nr:ABC transporter permease [Aquamicrobium sp. LC103]TKT69488.1 ABC transporter permease [Aquamicrobium sp. LC103]
MPTRFNLLIGSTILAVLFVAAILGIVWTPYDPMLLDMMNRLQPPSGQYWLGTDEFGRDILSRIMAGAATSVGIATATVLFAVVFGTMIGLVSGGLRGWFDRVLMAVTDAVLAFPGILLALVLIVILGAGGMGITLALAIAYMPAVVRVVRSTVLSVREKEFIEASRSIGNSELYTLAAHILPNCLAPISVLATSMFGWVILAESGLSFLGLGVPPPAPTWGNMLATSRPYFEQALWLSISPGLCIALALLGSNLVGDALRDRFDPRMAVA